MPSVQYRHPANTEEGKKERKDAAILTAILFVPIAVLVGFGLIYRALEALSILPNPWVTPFFTIWY